MKLSNFIEGINILRLHYYGEDGFHLSAEHDEFYMCATDTPLCESEVSRMRELGWSQADRDEDDPYDPELSWMVYT